MELFPKNAITDALRDVYLKHLVGKKFVRRSKYGGETFGEVKDVTVGLAFVFDKETDAIFNQITSLKGMQRDAMMKGEKFVKPNPLPKSENPWTGYHPTVTIKSTNNITYDLNEIFIIQKDKKKKK